MAVDGVGVDQGVVHERHQTESGRDLEAVQIALPPMFEAWDQRKHGDRPQQQRKREHHHDAWRRSRDGGRVTMVAFGIRVLMFRVVPGAVGERRAALRQAQEGGERVDQKRKTDRPGHDPICAVARRSVVRHRRP